MAEKKNNIFLHGYHFLRDHWGEMYVIYDLVKGFVDKEKPADDAHAVVKMVHGGKRSIEDEIAYEAIEIEGLTEEERELMRGFRLWAEQRFDDTFFGRRAYRNFDNDFRQMVMRMREEARVEYDTTTTKNAKGIETTKKVERRIAASNQPAIDFLRRLTASIKDGRDRTKGSRPKKIEAGNIQGCRYLREYNMPNPEASNVADWADQLLGKVPVVASTIGGAVVSAAGETAEAAGDWIDREHEKLEARNNQEGRLAGFRRWYRSLR
jgi:hypothetical protein